jgi:hypothetical protein
VLRILIVLVSLVAAAAFALEWRDGQRCADARNAIITSRGAEAGAIDTLREACRGTQARIDAAGALRAADREDQALVLAREAVEEEPDNARAWRAVAVLASGAERSAARERLRELDPRSLKRRAGRSTR